MNKLLDLPLPSEADREVRWHGLYGSALGLAIAETISHAPALIVITSDAKNTHTLEAQIRFFSGPDTDILAFPDWECLPYDQFSPHKDIVSTRLSTLHRLPRLTKGVVVLPVANLTQRVVPWEYVEARSFSLKGNDHIELNALRDRLQVLGYHAVGEVMEAGEYCVRGGVIDIYPSGATQPFRLELFDDQIDTIRYFDPETQRSIEKTNQISLLPAREIPLDPDAIKRFRRGFRSTFEGDPSAYNLYQDVSNGNAPPGIEFYLPLFFESTSTFFDYAPADAMFVVEEGIEDKLEEINREIADRYASAQLNPDRPPIKPEDLYLNSNETIAHIDQRKQIKITSFKTDHIVGNTTAYSSPVKPPTQFHIQPHQDSPFSPLIEFFRDAGDRCLLVAESPGRREVLTGLLVENGMRPTLYASWSEFLSRENESIGVTVSNLEQGLRLKRPAISVITESQLYGNRVLQRRRRSRAARDPESVIRSLAELKIDDPVVHEEHGVGRYRGLDTLVIENHEAEFLTIEYYGGDKLYIPVLSLGVVNRYVGAGADTAPLHKLGSEQWIRAKHRAQQKAHDVAVELLEVQALRQARKGHSFAAPDDGYAAFSAVFPFEETPDQAQGIDDILKDMTDNKPMDRLICGDVGFGKTEIALRASFLAVNDGKQTAVLAPTTLLAQQHYENFCDRFADFPVKIELLSRFRTAKQIQETIRLVSTGIVDVVIGTHRLLQKDLRFKRLGLVIIDEEHRFGVRQKEQLKRLRSQVDVLTLTATPIPRTLNSALSGLRDVSIIATPPRARLSIKTFVREWNGAVIREACLREIRRGGQIYFLHNQVRTITQQADVLQDLVPEAQIRIAHGQLRERDLETIMKDFYHQRFNLLLCTTIIESGIDIPTANTIVISRADKFGLAQLHQLRGRVGRSHHQAYAYLLTPPLKSLTGDSLKRLQAIEALEDLGAGFALASHDLEIRGAGELLGESQSGLIDEIGFSMYTEFLDRAIGTIRSQSGHAIELTKSISSTEINLHVPALLPDTYIPDVHQRLTIYKRISSALSEEALQELRAEMVDRFGSFPETAVTLFRLAEIRLRTHNLGINRIDLGPKGGRVVFTKETTIDPLRLIQLIESKPGVYSMRDAQTLVIDADLEDMEHRYSFMQDLVQALSD